MFGMNFGTVGQVTYGGLNTFSVVQGDGALPDSGDVMRIEGRQLGFVPWLLEQLNWSNPRFCFSASKHFLTMSKGDNEFSFVPTREIHSVSVGYGRNKAYILLTLISFIGLLYFLLMGVLGLIDDRSRVVEEAMIGGAGALFMVAVFWLLYKMSETIKVVATLISEDRRRSTFGVRLKSSISGAKVSPEQLHAAYVMMKKLCVSHNKFYP